MKVKKKHLKSLVAKIESIQVELDSVLKELNSTIIMTERNNNSKENILTILTSITSKSIKKKKVRIKNKEIADEGLFPDYSLTKKVYEDEPFIVEDDLKVQNPVKRLQPKKNQAELYEDKIKENRIGDLNAPDLVRYFKNCADRKGIRYIANWGKDASIMKKLLENELTQLDIIGMIDFLFFSKQTYLDKKDLGIGILASGWVNKVYQDSLLWLDDRYTEKDKKVKSERKRQSNWDEEETSIGELGGE